MAGGVGGLIANLMQGDPSAQLGQALAGPNPSPSPQGAPGPASPGGAPPQQQQQQALPPAQAYAPDPANASTIQQLLKVYQNDQAGASINRGIAQMAAGFGTAQQQHDKMGLVNSAGQSDDTLGALGQIQKLQSDQMELQNKQRFQASADMLAQTFGLKPGQGAMLSSDPQLFNLVIGHKVADQSPTELQKNIKAYQEMAHANGLPDDQIQAAVQMAFTNSITPGLTIDDKNRMKDAALWQQANPGKPLPPNLASIAGYAEQNKDNTATMNAAAKDRIASKSSMGETQATLKPIYDNVSQMLDPANIDHVVTAIKSGGYGTTGMAGNALGAAGFVDPKTLEMRNAVEQLQGQLSADTMKSLKNIRTQTEFQSVTGGATPIFKSTATGGQIKQGLLTLKDKLGLANANAIAAGGGEVPAEYADKVDKAYLTPGDPLYNNATIAKGQGAAGSPADAAPMDGAKQAPDGHWYVPDPKRQGKYLRVDK